MSNAKQTLASAILTLCEDKKGERITLFDVSKTSTMTDALILTGVSNDVLGRALQEAVLKFLKDKGELVRVSGSPESGWLVVDAGEVVLHLVRNDIRDYYQLDQLFSAKAVVYHH
ncbi:MAG: ribosome silencing factor [Candidatus Margulisiibacteriota bacterium]